MRPKSLLLLALALGCGLVASIGISQVMEQKNAQQGPKAETSPIYIALHNINLGDPIDANMVTLQEWPKDRIPAGSLTKIEEIEGRRPRANIIAGMPIVDAQLLAQGEFADPIGEIPPGFRLATIAVDAQKSAAGLLSPGDRVDIQLYVERNERTGVAQSMTKVILQNIRVFAVEQAVQRSADGGDTRTVPKTVSLLVTVEQANKLDLAQQIGEVNLIPRSPDDQDTAETAEVDIGILLGGKTEKNDREEEQQREATSAKNDPKGPGFIGSMMAMMKKAADERPPFTMEILEAAEVREVQFDPSTGRPIRVQESSSNGVPAQPASFGGVPGQPTLAPTPAGEENDFPIDFGDK